MVEVAMPYSKAEKKRQAVALIERYCEGEIFNVDDLTTFSILCGHQFLSVKRCAGRMVSVVCKNDSYSGTWSWRKSIDGWFPHNNMVQAMRTAIRLGKMSTVEKKVCEECGANRDLTVDHKSPAFASIVVDFVKNFGNPQIVNVSGFGWVLEQPSEFICFHDAVAEFQCLCRSCNSRKGVR